MTDTATPAAPRLFPSPEFPTVPLRGERAETEIEVGGLEDAETAFAAATGR